MSSDELGLFVQVVSCVGRLSGESFRVFLGFFLGQIFRPSFCAPIAILRESMRRERQEERLPKMSSLLGIHRIDDRSLGCAVVNRARAPTSRSPSIPRFWNSRVHYGRGRQASPHADPHNHHGITKESSPDVPVLLRMSDQGSPAVQQNVDVAYAPDGPKKET